MRLPAHGFFGSHCSGYAPSRRLHAGAPSPRNTGNLFRLPRSEALHGMWAGVPPGPLSPHLKICQWWIVTSCCWTCKNTGNHIHWMCRSGRRDLTGLDRESHSFWAAHRRRT